MPAMADAGMAHARSGEQGLWRNRNWRLLFTGQAVSMTGDFIFDVTVVLWIATRIAVGQTWAPLAVGGALIAVAAPVMLIGPFAGVFVDRWDRRRTMMAADVIRAVLVASLLLVPVFEDRLSVAAQLVCVYGVVALASAAAQFFNGSRFAIIANVIPPQDQPRASAIGQTVVAVAGVVGPPLAAPLLFSVGIQWALIVNALSFLISYVATQQMRVEAVPAPAEAKPSFRRELAEGARFFVRSRVLVGLMICIVVVQLGIGAINALDVFFVTDNLHAAASALGTLGAAFGLGSIVGALIAAAIGNRLNPVVLFWSMLAFTGVVVIGYSRADTLAVGFALLLVAGAPIAIVNSVAGPILLNAAPQHLLGRIMAVFNPIQQASSIVGMAVVTYLASTSLRGLDIRILGIHFGRIDVIFFIAGVLIVAAGLWVAIPLRAVDTSPITAAHVPAQPEPHAVTGVAELSAAGDGSAATLDDRA
jgi:MFS family permease